MLAFFVILAFFGISIGFGLFITSTTTEDVDGMMTISGLILTISLIVLIICAVFSCGVKKSEKIEVTPTPIEVIITPTPTVMPTMTPEHGDIIIHNHEGGNIYIYQD